MENKEETDIEDEEIVLDDSEITPEEDPDKVTVVRDERVCKQTSEGDQIIGEGKSIIKPNPKAKESGQRSWFDLS